MSELNIGSGDVAITIAGNDLVLRPTLKACIALSTVDGGISQLAQRCAALDFNAIKMVIEYGLGVRSKELAENIFKSGLINLNSPCITYLHVIANGGKMPGDEGEDETEEVKAPLENSSL